MAKHSTRQRYIPFRKTDLVKMLLAEKGREDNTKESFRELCEILFAFFHFEFHEKIETIKDCYAPFGADISTKRVEELSPQEAEETRARLRKELCALADAANFQPVEKADLDRALEEESLLKVRLVASFDDFAEVLVFRRGESVRTEETSHFFGLKKKKIRFITYDRVLLYLQYPETEDLKRETNDISAPASPHAPSIVKLFQNVPKADLEMLFPNAQVRMRTVDKLAIGLPALVTGGVTVTTKLLAAIGLFAAILGSWLGIGDDPKELDQTSVTALALTFGSLGAFLFKQWTKFKNRKIQFMKTLSDHLYFRNLDNGAGVFHNLLDAAEEEESKEAILAYHFLLTAGTPLSHAEIDERIEHWLETKWKCPVNFEIDDALSKLSRLGLIEKSLGKTWYAVPLDKAKRHLDQLWDNHFSYHDAAKEAEEATESGVSRRENVEKP